MQRNNYLLKFSAISIGVFLSFNLFGAGFQINEVSPSIQATALSNAATASNDISGIAFNPAVLATTHDSNVYVAGSMIAPQVSYNNAKSTSNGFDALPASLTGPYVYSLPANAPNSGVNSESNISTIAFVPAIYLGTTIPEAPRVKAGLGIDSPFGMSTQYDSNWVGQYNALDSSIKTLNIFPTLSYQVMSRLAVGGSINFERISANYSNNTFQSIYDLSDNGFPTAGATDIADIHGSSTLHGAAWGTGLSLGAIYNITPSTTLGADYHSAVKESINGTATIGNTCSSQYSFCPFITQNTPLPNGKYDGSITIKLPASMNLGISQKINSQLTLMAGAQWTQWNSIQAINANVSGIGQVGDTLDWRNTWLYSLGASYILTPKWTMMGGLAYDETPTVNQYRDARIPDTNRKWLTAGFRYAPTANLTLLATYEHIFMNKQSVNVTNSAPGAASANVSADYEGYANILAAGLNYSF